MVQLKTRSVIPNCPSFGSYVVLLPYIALMLIVIISTYFLAITKYMHISIFNDYEYFESRIGL